MIVKTFYKLITNELDNNQQNSKENLILFTCDGNVFSGGNELINDKVRADDNLEEISIDELCKFSRETRDKFLNKLLQENFFDIENEPYKSVYNELIDKNKIYPFSKYSKVIDGNPINIATVNNENKPNIGVASDVFILNDNIMIISVNSLTNTPKNIENNKNVVLISLDKYWNGVRIFGTAEVIKSGKYYDMTVEKYADERTRPKAAIVIKVERYELLS